MFDTRSLRGHPNGSKLKLAKILSWSRSDFDQLRTARVLIFLQQQIASLMLPALEATEIHPILGLEIGNLKKNRLISALVDVELEKDCFCIFVLRYFWYLEAFGFF
jgi:hypothetical protein